ncbi:hypothetical protein [Marinomonas sp. THO17]|uniref:hypothetical protein n=1 Tax=Marinomonas sp. THO17 TaxID=3149048 RepID=UPI00336BB928
MTIMFSAYWGSQEAREIDLHMMALTPHRKRRAMAQLSREITKLASQGVRVRNASERNFNWRVRRWSWHRTYKISKGYLPYRYDTQRNNYHGILTHFGDNQLAALAESNDTQTSTDGWDWRDRWDPRRGNRKSRSQNYKTRVFVGQQASTVQQKQWSSEPTKRIQARRMQQLGLRRDPTTQDKRPVSQTWIRQHISQLHGLSLLLELNDRDNGAQSVLSNWLQRERFSNDPQWVRAIAAAVVAIN